MDTSPKRCHFTYCGLRFRVQRYDTGKHEIDQMNEDGLAIFLGYAEMMGACGSAGISALKGLYVFRARQAELGGQMGALKRALAEAEEALAELGVEV